MSNVTHMNVTQQVGESRKRALDDTDNGEGGGGGGGGDASETTRQSETEAG